MIPPLLQRMLGRLALFAAGAFGLLWLASCTLADKLIFMPRPSSYGTDHPGLFHLETESRDQIAALHFPARPGQPTVLYSHGNAEDIGESGGFYDALQKEGWGVLAYDYPGYGQSTGQPSEEGCEEAIDAAWKHLTAGLGIAPDNIVIMGRSVGSGPSVWLASREHPRALVLVSPFTSTFAVLPPAQYLLPADRFPNLRRIRRRDLPLLVIHGENDRVIPFDHGRTLHQASPARKKHFVALPATDHNDLYFLRLPTVIDELVRFAGN